MPRTVARPFLIIRLKQAFFRRRAVVTKVQTGLRLVRLRLTGLEMSMRIDHVIYGTADLDAAAIWFLRMNLGWGSRRAVDMTGVARTCVALEQGDGLLGWAVGVEDIDGFARRSGTVTSAVGRDGMVARLTGDTEAIAKTCLP
jgi:hypothetical protein